MTHLASFLPYMDVLSPSLSRPSVAIGATSTSYGADAIITTNNIKNLQDLRGKDVYGLEKSVSQYLVARALEQAGMKESDVNFKQMDPGAAAQAMQGRQKGFEAIVVWEPYLLQTLATRKNDVHVLVDSKKIQGEIIDMIVVGADVLKKPGGEDFAHAILDAYYQVNQWLKDPKTSDTTHVALGEKFSNLDAAQMKDVLTRCRFFSTPDKGAAIFTNPSFPDVMKKVVSFCKSHEIVAEEPTISYNHGLAENMTLKKAQRGPANLIFDPSYMATVNERK